MGGQESGQFRGAVGQEVREALIAPETSVLVSPMGFLPEYKRRLLDSAEAHRLQLATVSEVGRGLREAVSAFSDGRMDLDTFLRAAGTLDEFVSDGEKAHEEEVEFIKHALRTGEELAVILARVSRSPVSFDENARAVTEEGAAKFHQKWVVSVEGYGHASVAEHAIIHLGVWGIPSLDGDWITDNRLASYTEFSARFGGRQGLDYFTPESVARDPVLAARWHEVHRRLFELNDILLVSGMEYVQTDEALEKWPTRRVDSESRVRKLVSDQFKDLMPASRLTSIGLTMNAREAENIIRKFLSAPYPSVRALGALIKEQALRVAPTLVKYADRNDYMVAAREGVGKLASEGRFRSEYSAFSPEREMVDLIGYDPQADEKFLAGAMYSDSSTGSYRQLLGSVGRMNEGQRRDAILKLLGGLKSHDVPIRALEMVSPYQVEYPKMRYGPWRDYKRHRLQFYDAKDLDVRYGYAIPPLAYEMDQSADSRFHGTVEAIRRVMGDVEELFNRVSQVDPYAAQYAVTRLHYRPAIASLNLREAFHMVDLRSGGTAIWSIRQFMWPFLDEMKRVHPLIHDHLRTKMRLRPRPNRDFPWTF